jgi:hypothetical protein
MVDRPCRRRDERRSQEGLARSTSLRGRSTPRPSQRAANRDRRAAARHASRAAQRPSAAVHGYAERYRGPVLPKARLAHDLELGRSRRREAGARQGQLEGDTGRGDPQTPHTPNADVELPRRETAPRHFAAIRVDPHGDIPTAVSAGKRELWMASSPCRRSWPRKTIALPSVRQIDATELFSACPALRSSARCDEPGADPATRRR